jgi:hypothetical protein
MGYLCPRFEHSDLAFMCHECLYRMAADEPGSSCCEDLHDTRESTPTRNWNSYLVGGHAQRSAAAMKPQSPDRQCR